MAQEEIEKLNVYKLSIMIPLAVFKISHKENSRSRYMAYLGNDDTLERNSTGSTISHNFCFDYDPATPQLYDSLQRNLPDQTPSMPVLGWCNPYFYGVSAGTLPLTFGTFGRLSNWEHAPIKLKYSGFLVHMAAYV